MVSILLGVVSPSEVLAMPACTLPNAGAPTTGNERVAGGQTGVYSLVEVFNPLRCVGSAFGMRSATISYVHLVGDILTDYFEVGYAECGPGGICAQNGGVPYYYYMYSRGPGSGGCGGGFVTTGYVKAPKGNVGSAPTFHDFEVSRSASGNYYAYIDEVSQYGKAGWTIDDCWADGDGVQLVAWAGQTYDVNDQLGGTVSNHQQYQGVQYKNSTGWHQVTRPTSSPCDFSDNPSVHKCSWGSTSGTFFNVWDTRAP